MRNEHAQPVNHVFFRRACPLCSTGTDGHTVRRTSAERSNVGLAHARPQLEQKQYHVVGNFRMDWYKLVCSACDKNLDIQNFCDANMWQIACCHVSIMMLKRLTKQEKDHHALDKQHVLVQVNCMGMVFQLYHTKIYSVGYWSDIPKFAPTKFPAIWRINIIIS